MPLFEMKPGELVAVPSSTFTTEKVLERADLQRLLRARIDAIADDVLIVAEEFGAFADAKRRIDLLGIDREGQRQAILTMVTTLRASGVPAGEIAKAIPPSRFLSVGGTLAGAELREAFVLAYPKGDPSRWFMEAPVHDDGRTWIVTKMWGRNTEPVLERLVKLAPQQSGIAYEAVPS